MFKIYGTVEGTCRKEHMPNMKALSLRIKKLWLMRVFQKYVKGHGEGHMFKIYGTVGGPRHKEYTSQIWKPCHLGQKDQC